MSAQLHYALPSELKPLPAWIGQLGGLNDVLRLNRANAISFGCDELFELNDKILRIEDDYILVFRYEDLRRIGSMPVVANVPSAYSQKRFLFEPLGISESDPDFDQVRRFTRNGFFTAMPAVHDLIKPTFSKPLMPKGMPPFARIAEEIANDLVSRFAGAGKIDFTKDFAQPLAFDLWALVLGMSDAEKNALRDIMKDMSPITTPGDLSRELLVSLNRAIEGYLGVLIPVLTRARKAGNVAFLEAVAQQFSMIVEPPPNMPESLEAMVATAMFDAFHALGAGFASCVYALVDNPQAYGAVRDDPALVTNAVSEGLRLYAPVRIIARYAMAEFAYEGLRVPSGALLALNWGAGGRDPAVFDEPRKFDLFRPAIASQTFGAGGQICPGRNIVRTLCAAGLSVLTRPGVSMKLVGDVSWHSASPLTFNTQLTRFPITLVRT